tara:strand:+ start:682 stop:1704 length:1023 start_codon:yes stop_codon:yes gene_type:complete
MNSSTGRKFKEVVFVYGRHGGGAIMSSIQPSYCLNKHGIRSYAVHSSDFLNTNSISKHKDSLIIFVRLPINLGIWLNILRENNNTLVCHLGDRDESAWHRALETSSHLYDIYLTHGKHEHPKTRVIKHTYDLFLDHTSKKKQEFKILWCGNKCSSGKKSQGEYGLSESGYKYDEKLFKPLEMYLSEFKKTKNSLDINSRVKNIIDNFHKEQKITEHIHANNIDSYALHYCVRTPQLSDFSFLVKSSTKLSQAIGCESNIIISLGPPERAIIDESYRYSIDTTTEEFSHNGEEICKEMIARAQKEFNTKHWFDSLKYLSQFKKDLHPLSFGLQIVKYAEEL